MTRLAPILFDRRFDDLTQLGRSRLPGSAPAWTDHNAHDPGITFMELLAWVAEAQIYSLAKTRRDERQAYAGFMGVEPHGARPARGLIWSNPADPDGPLVTLRRGRIIDRDFTARLERSEAPGFHPEHKQVLIPARVADLTSRLADGTILQHLEPNLRGGPAFQPFGSNEARGAVLRMTLQATGAYPLFEPGRPAGTCLIIGVRAAGVSEGGSKLPSASPLQIMLVAEGEHIQLPVLKDSSAGMLRTGFLVLDLSPVGISPMSAILEFRAPGGLPRAPRLLRIEPNVVPIVQSTKRHEEHESDGLPDQTFDLTTPGLQFEPGSDPLTIDVEAGGAMERWSKADRLDRCGPGDRCFAMDPSAGRITFGNGINGAVPPINSRVRAAYLVSEGKAGNLAANRKWVISGFVGLFGLNPDPVAEGEDASGWLDQRREARARLRTRHALVSAADYEEAARGLADLDVGRAWMMPPSDGDLATGTMRLIVLRKRDAGREGDMPPETPEWLASVHEQLQSRVALGSRIRVLAPRYVSFAVSARLEAEAQEDPEVVRRHALEQLRKRVALVGDRSDVRLWPFGLPVSRRDLIAWLRSLPDVRRVLDLSIRADDGGSVQAVNLPRHGLPHFLEASSDIQVVRIGQGTGP